MSSVRYKPSVFTSLLVAILCCNYFQFGSTDLSVAISRIPGQPNVLYSGAEVTLTCIITYNGNTSLQASWHNGTQVLQASDNVQLTAPYLVLGNVYLTTAHISVLVSHTSSYRCDISWNGSPISEQLQVQVMDSGTKATVDVKYPSGNIYALVPFGISCLIHVPVEVTFSFHISWLRNGELLSESDFFSSHSTSLNSSAFQSDIVVEEPVPGEAAYTCEVTGIVNGYTVLQETRTLPTFSVQAFPEPAIQILTIPKSDPVANSPYTLSCQASVDSALLDMVEISWLDQLGKRIRESTDISISSQIQNGGMAVLNIMFPNVFPELEGTYTCIAELELVQYDTVLTSEESIFVSAPEQITGVHISSLLQTSQTWVAGSDAALLCTAEVVKATSVSLTWETFEGPIISSESIKESGTSALSDNVFQSTLEFRAVLPSVTNLYFCTAQLNTTSLATYAYVDVESDLAPLIAMVTSNQAIAGGSGQLVCVVAVPDFYQDLPLFVWTRSNGARVGDESHVLEIPVNNGTHAFQVLNIFPVSLLDRGEFVCTVAYQILGISQDVTSHVQASNFLTVQIATPSVAVSLAIESTDSDALQLTCHVQLDGLEGFTPMVETSWYFTRNTNTGIERELIPNLSSSQMSTVKVVSCGKQYSSDLRLVQLAISPGTNEITCIADVSIPNDNNVISSQGEGGILIQDLVEVEKPPSEPNEPSIRELGSSWAEIYWELPNNNSQQNYFIEYINTITEQRTESARVFGDLFAAMSTYSAVLTDLHPATRYEFRVVAENVLGTEEGNFSTFATMEAIPTGAPQDFQREAAANNGEWIFKWKPPAEQSQNGIITSYNFSCYPPTRTGVLQNGYSIVTTTHINIDSLAQETNYTCSVAARTAEGEGPITSLQFSLLDPTQGPVSQEECPQDLQVYLYILGGVSAIFQIICIILAVALVATCCSKKKSPRVKYAVTAIRTPTCSPPTTPSRPLNDYVLSPPPKVNSTNLSFDSDLSQV